MFFGRLLQCHRDERNFIKLTQGTTAVYCTLAKIVDVQHRTRMATLFLDQTQNSDKLCRFRFGKMQPTVEMVGVRVGQLLISNAKFIILQC